MNYTAGSMLNCEAVPDAVVHPTCSGMPPISETMRKTNDVLMDCRALANKLNDLLAHVQEEKTKAPPDSCDSMQKASMLNCDLAVEVMHKLEMALNVLGG